MQKEKKQNPLTKLIIILVVIFGLTFGAFGYIIYSDGAEKSNFIEETVNELVEANPDASIDEIRAYVEENYDTLKEQADAKAETEGNAVEATTEVDVAEEDYPVATIEIEDIGTMEFELYPMTAPQSVYNFIYLAENNFYDGLIMHRIEPQFVAQGGDPLGTGAGGPGYTIKGEFASNGIKNDIGHGIGSLSMARSSENDSAGSQFYIGLTESVTSLDSDYATFGKIISGEDLISEIQKHDTTADPEDTLTITKVTVDTKGIDYPEPTKLNEDPETEALYGLE